MQENIGTNLEQLKQSPLYSEELGISLAAADDREYFKWFLASLLFGGHISESIAKNTYRAFARHDLLAPERILDAGFDYLVNPIMREGGYVRYDGRKSTQILRDCEYLLQTYGGSLSALHEEAADSGDLERRLQTFYGIGPVTVNIFLREMRPYWSKARPEPLPAVQAMAVALGIDLDRYRSRPLLFCRLEAGLLRLSKQRRSAAGGGKPGSTSE